METEKIEQTPAKSGYARLRRRHHALIEKHEATKAECMEWKRMYLELRMNLSPLIDAVTPRSGTRG